MKRELAIFLSAGAMLCAEVATARDAAFERAPYMDASLSIDARLDDMRGSCVQRARIEGQGYSLHAK